ncbi:hypothetical protein RSAG8_04482, partial [Rhizoctonia solani AG-8 WAC10335]
MIPRDCITYAPLSVLVYRSRMSCLYPQLASILYAVTEIVVLLQRSNHHDRPLTAIGLTNQLALR